MSLTLIAEIINNHNDTIDNFKTKEVSLDFLQSLDDVELISYIIEPSLSNASINKVLEVVNDRDPTFIMEVVNLLNNSFITVPSYSVLNICDILLKNDLVDFPKKILIIENILENSPNDDWKFKTFNSFLSLLKDIINYPLDRKIYLQVNTTLIFNTLLNLLKSKFVNDENKVFINTLLIELFNLKDAEESFKYKLFNILIKDSNINDYFLTNVSTYLSTFPFQNYKYNLFICQYLKNKNTLSSNSLEYIYNIANTNNNENTIADISDFLLSIDSYKDKAIELFNKIQYSKNTTKTLYNNKQNLHYIDIDTSIKPFFDKLASINFIQPTLLDNSEESITNTISYIKIQTADYITNEELVDRSITRISLDNTLYTDKHLSMIQIFFRVFLYIQTYYSLNKELLKRFTEELEDMADTCSSGHLVRFANIFSGFELNMRINVEEEFKSCIFTRLQNIINSKPPEVLDLIFDNENIEVDDYYSSYSTSTIVYNNNFLKVLSTDIFNLNAELYREYVEQNILDENTYSELFRKYINLFQTGETI